MRSLAWALPTNVKQQSSGIGLQESQFTMQLFGKIAEQPKPVRKLSLIILIMS